MKISQFSRDCSGELEERCVSSQASSRFIARMSQPSLTTVGGYGQQNTKKVLVYIDFVFNP